MTFVERPLLLPIGDVVTNKAEAHHEIQNISVEARMSSLRALITSIFVYGCETINAEMVKLINVFEINCMRRLLQIHYSSHTPNKSYN